MSDDEEAVATAMGFSSFGKASKRPQQQQQQQQQQQKKEKDKEKEKDKDKEKEKEKEKQQQQQTRPEAGGADLPADYMQVFQDSLRIARERNAGSERRELIGPALPESAPSELPQPTPEEKRKKEKKEKKERKKEKKEKKKKKKEKKEKDEEEKEEEEEEEEELIGPPIPAELLPAPAVADASETSEVSGKADAGKDDDKDDDDDDDDEDDDDDDDEEEEEARSLFAPVSQELYLDHHSGKPVVALGADGAGGRVVSGGSDFSVRFWNFAGMDSSCRSFKTLEQPCGAHQIRYLGFNTSSDCVLFVSGSAQARLYTRDGALLSETVKGYQYISNPRSAPGHTHGLYGGCWHPRDAAEFMTCSSDTSVRLWDVNNTEKILTDVRIKKSRSVAVPKNAQGRAVAPTACAYSPDGLLLFAGCSDGSLQAWDRRRHFVNNSHLLRGAHAADTVTCLAFSYDAVALLSRSMDDTLKLWDLRQLKQPLFAHSGISTQYEQTACGFSPNDRLLFTAACAPAKLCEKEGRPAGQLLFFDRRSLAPVESLTSTYSAGVVRCSWHPKINQLLLSLADGRACVLFDQRRSVNGAKLCAGRPAKRRQTNAYKDGYVQESLLTYDDDSMREVRQGKRKSKFYELEGQGQASRKVYQAEAPVSGPGYGGKVGQKGATLHQYMLMQMVKKRGEDPAEKDIRGAILRHQADAEKNPQWTGVYARTQPKPVFQEAGDEAKPEEAKRPRLL